jgi:hypothetical protein
MSAPLAWKLNWLNFVENVMPNPSHNRLTFWERLHCLLTGRCQRHYEPKDDPLVRRYDRIERDLQQERRFRPRDLIDPR